MEIIIASGIFFAIVFLIEGVGLVFRVIHDTESRRLNTRLKNLSSMTYENQAVDIVRKKSLSEIPWLNKLLLNAPLMNRLHLLLQQANVKYSLGFFILLSLLLATFGFYSGSLIFKSHMVMIPVALFLGSCPFFYIYRKKKKRMQRFEQQLPDAVEMLSRSLRAGHSLSSGMKIISLEFAEPLGTEFKRTIDEINFGINVEEVLGNLSRRIDCPDIRFFVVATILQRETGGDLAEILDNIGHIIRERFKLRGRVRALSAEGRISAYILFALPFVFAFVIYFINPEYIKTLATDPIGKILVFSAMIWMFIGAIILKIIINIQV